MHFFKLSYFFFAGNEVISCVENKTYDSNEMRTSEYSTEQQQEIVIILEPTWLDPIFPYLGAAVIVLLNVLFGTEISLKDIRFILMRPKPLIAAALCQFVLLPPVSVPPTSPLDRNENSIFCSDH